MCGGGGDIIVIIVIVIVLLVGIWLIGYLVDSYWFGLLLLVVVGPSCYCYCYYCYCWYYWWQTQLLIVLLICWWPGYLRTQTDQTRPGQLNSYYCGIDPTPVLLVDPVNDLIGRTPDWPRYCYWRWRRTTQTAQLLNDNWWARLTHWLTVSQ